jgi:hypothetical protein
MIYESVTGSYEWRMLDRYARDPEFESHYFFNCYIWQIGTIYKLLIRD